MQKQLLAMAAASSKYYSCIKAIRVPLGLLALLVAIVASIKIFDTPLYRPKMHDYTFDIGDSTKSLHTENERALAQLLFKNVPNWQANNHAVCLSAVKDIFKQPQTVLTTQQLAQHNDDNFTSAGAICNALAGVTPTHCGPYTEAMHLYATMQNIPFRSNAIADIPDTAIGAHVFDELWMNNQWVYCDLTTNIASVQQNNKLLSFIQLYQALKKEDTANLIFNFIDSNITTSNTRTQTFDILYRIIDGKFNYLHYYHSNYASMYHGAPLGLPPQLWFIKECSSYQPTNNTLTLLTASFFWLTVAALIISIIRSISK